MTEPFVPRVGAVWSADIAVPEHEREVRFSSRVLRRSFFMYKDKDNDDEPPCSAAFISHASWVDAAV